MTRPLTQEELERFAEVIEKAEALGEADPRGYRKRVVALALLGPALFVAAVLGVALLAAAGLYLLIDGELIGAAPLLLAGLLLRMSWVRLPLPAGHRLNAEKYARLCGEINEYRQKLKAASLDEVRIGSGFDVEMVATPLFGALPIDRVSLVIGLPLLTALPSTEAGALIARELAHLSGRCGRAHRLVMRNRAVALRLMEALQGDESRFAAPLGRFYDWYAPLLNAYSLPLARRLEQEADAAAAEVTSAEAVALALVSRTAKLGAADELFWTPLWARANDEPEPVPDAWSRLAEFYRGFAVSNEQLAALMAQSQQPVPGSAEPALVPRLEALEAKPRRPREFRHSAAEKFLGERYLPWLGKLDEEWADEQLTRWQERYIDTQNAQARLVDLGLVAMEQLPDDDLWELGTLTERLSGREAALGAYWAWHKRNPAEPKGELAVGRVLLARGDVRGLKMLERAAEIPEFVIEACQAAVEYLERSGDRTQAAAWRTRANLRAQEEQAAARERATVRPNDTFEPAQINNEQLKQLKLALGTVPGLEEAHIACKKVHHLPERRLYLLACKVVVGQGERIRRQIEERAHALGGEVRVLFSRGPDAKSAGKVRRIGAEVLSQK